MKKQFIKSTEKYSTLSEFVPAPLFRKSFQTNKAVTCATLSVCGLGFYRLYINGTEITKGHIAPYISNPDHICYYDTYDIASFLNTGTNVIGVILGNGFQNAFGGAVWDFEKADHTGAPRLALELSVEYEDGSHFLLEADESFKTSPSPILMDDLRLGEIYDARNEQRGWCEADFDDSAWQNATKAETPRGELVRCEAEPIVVTNEISPVSVTKQGDAYLYDFGINTAGVCRLRIRAERGQRITLWHGEILKDGKFYNDNIRFSLEKHPFYAEYNQTLRYIASGCGEEIYTPSFSYQGFRYVLVEGITEAQATKELLTYLVMHSDLKTIGGFRCSDERVNKLYRMAVNADLSNFFYFPTDCPHREKNGWTGDASMSADHHVLTYDVKASWRAWLDNIRKAQNDQGALPGIVPTGGWGFKWGNGPTWDSVLFNLPYMLYQFRGDTETVRQNAHAMMRYLSYIMTRKNADGTVSVGLGDWVPVGKKRSGAYDAPLAVTDSIMVMDMARKASEMLAAIGYSHEAAYANGIYEEMRQAIRRELVDLESMTVKGECQSSQCIALYYGVFDEAEEPEAFKRLLSLIRAKNNTFDCGFIGMHTIFHVLSRFGRADLAYEMIMRRDFPGYGHLIEVGETALPEKLMADPLAAESHNHHFLGDYMRWFVINIAGLEVKDSHTVRIAPQDIEGIDFAEAWYELPAGRVAVRWAKNEAGERVIRVTAPDGVEIIR